MIPGIGSMGGELLILLTILILLFFGATQLPAFGRSYGTARLGDEDETKQRPRNKKDGKELAPNAGKGERSV
jgi:Sec-independent protein translocase protein TatA